MQSVLAATANPESPNEVDVSQPSAALTARAAAQSALNSLFLGLGAVALLVGAVGVANIMVISVLERRSEIGLRRALGATRGHIRVQFLSEAILLSLLGGAVGVGAGALATAIYAQAKGWAGGHSRPGLGRRLGAALAIGALAGLRAGYPRRPALADRGAVERVIEQAMAVGTRQRAGSLVAEAASVGSTVSTSSPASALGVVLLYAGAGQVARLRGHATRRARLPARPGFLERPSRLRAALAGGRPRGPAPARSGAHASPDSPRRCFRAVFLVAMSQALARGLAIGCGCFGGARHAL